MCGRVHKVCVGLLLCVGGFSVLVNFLAMVVHAIVVLCISWQFNLVLHPFKKEAG
jgi:hypothetical protein